MANNTVVVSRPIKDGCNFNAVGNPVIYKLRREDYQFDQINDNGGFAQIQINGTDLTSYFEVGDSVYVEGIGAAIVSASSFSTNTLITIDISFSATSTGYINNNSKRTDYKIEAEVFNAATDESLGPRIVDDPDQAGEVRVNISGIVRAFLSAEWENPTTNEVEEKTSLEVYIKYQEFYDVTYWELINDVATPVVCVFAVIPLLLGSPPDFSRYAHGGNLIQFYPEDDTRYWLTRFETPSYWRGFPFSLSFIWPSTIPDIDRKVIQYDSQGDEISTDITNLTSEVDKIHRMSLGSINANTKRIVVTLIDGSVSGEVPILADLEIDAKDPCDSQVLLFWKNTLGGDAFWMFDESQEYEWTYPNGKKVKRMRLFSDNLKIKDWDAINELNSASEVINYNIVDYEMSDVINKTQFRNDNQVYIISSDGEKVGVIVVPTGNQTKTIYKKHAIEITIELPELFLV
jgi:hypothetical protein